MMINVAHIMRTYGTHGGEKQLAQMFQSFEDISIKHIFFFIYNDSICEEYFSKITKIETEKLLGIKSKIYSSEFKNILFFICFLPILQIRFALALRRNKCKICVAHGFYGLVVTWFSAIIMRKVKFVYIHRGTKSSKRNKWVFQCLYRPFDKIAGVSKASAASLKKFAPDKVPLSIENGINFKKVNEIVDLLDNKKEDIFSVICIGRLIYSKSQSLIIDAFFDFLNNFPNAKLQIVGDGPDEQLLKQQVTDLGISQNVVFLGNQSDILSLLRQSDVFVHASQSEGLSNAVLEAMATGLPSIVVDAPGVSECHIDATTAYIVPRSKIEISKCLLKLYQDHELRNKLGRNAKIHVIKHYSIESNCKRYANLYRELL